MNQRLERRQEELGRPLTVALLRYLQARRSPTRVTIAREDLGFSSREFTMALRALTRHGFAREMRVSGVGRETASLNQHLFVEAVAPARDFGPAATTEA